MNLIHLDIIKALFVSAVINGVVAVPLMVLVILLGSDRTVMKERVSRPWGRAVTWLAAAVMGAAAVGMVATMLIPELPRL
jgi:Mn2+/Fe2+ NRAMP family transporter